MVFLGSFNSRLKDYYDIYLLAEECDFEGSLLVKAFIATFRNRKTKIPLDTPVALSEGFAVTKQGEWSRFLEGANYDVDRINGFLEVIEFMRKFLLPPMQAAAMGEVFGFHWKAGGSWVI